MQNKYLKFIQHLSIYRRFNNLSAKGAGLVFSGWLIIMMLWVGLFIAQPGWASGTELQNQLNTVGIKAWGVQAGPTSLAQIVQYAVQAFLGLLGIIFIILIIFAGYNWLTAGGDEEKVTKAKQTLTRAVIGLVIIVGAYAITYFVFSSLPSGSGNSGFGG